VASTAPRVRRNRTCTAQPRATNTKCKARALQPLADFDWSFPSEIDRELIDQLFTLDFITEPANVLIIGQNGAGKTMLAKNLAHHAIVNGYSARFISASELLNDLAAQTTGSALTARLRHYCRPQLLVIDELGYLASSSEHADLLFELVTRRYQHKPIVITANKAFTEWGEVFPNASCVVALIDRLFHKAEIVKISVSESFRLKDARERSEQRKKARTPTRKQKV
jgi:DNA replication protein DnaC